MVASFVTNESIVNLNVTLPDDLANEYEFELKKVRSELESSFELIKSILSRAKKCS
jgi:hypothetical protein